MDQSFKIGFILWTHHESVKTPGLYHLKERTYVDGKARYKKTNIFLKIDQWDEGNQMVKDHPDAKGLNARLRKSLRDRSEKIDKAVVNGHAVTHEMFSKNPITLETLIKKTYYHKNADYLWYLLCEFRTGGLHFRDLTNDSLRAFEQWMRDSGCAHSVICVQIFMLRGLCKKAKEMNLIAINPFLPFGDYYKAPALEEIEKSFLFEEERDAFFDFFITLRNYYRINPDFIKPRKVEGKGYYTSAYCQYKSLVYFLLGCFTAIRISDWKLFDAITRVQMDGYVRLRAKKNGEWVVHKIGPRLRMVLDEIKVIGKLDLAESTIRRKIKEITKQLKIKKKVGPHTSRHTFGYMCAKRAVPKDVAKELMGITSDAIDYYYHLISATIKEYAETMAD